MSAVRRLCLPVILLVASIGSARADAGAPEPVRREVIALFDGAFETEPSDTLLHTNVEMPLNHLGYVLRYHDLREGVPDESEMRDAAAIVTMFGYEVSDPARYLAWLPQAVRSVPRFVSLGTFGVKLTEGNLHRLDPVMRRIGLRVLPSYVSGTSSSRAVVLKGDVIGFEGAPDPVVPSHPVVVRAGGEADVLLEYESELLGERVRSVVAATGPGGGYVAGGFALSYDEALDVKRWQIDPFAFFERALGRPDFPVPDATTMSGRRIYFSHVDGDGWINLSAASRDPAKPQFSSEVMLQRLIEPYPDLPVSVGLVGGDVDPQLGGGEAAAELARRIYALPQVEVASHTMTHPFSWSFFDPYDRAREEALVREAGGPGPSGLRRFASSLGLPLPGGSHDHSHVAGSSALPRAYLRDPFSFDTEIGGALRLAGSLAPPAKRAAIYLWSGDTLPTERAIRATREAGVRNMNGGDVRFDTHRPSISYVAPLSRVVGVERQIYSGNSNENNYTKLWTDHFYGFRYVRETFERTGSPRRLKPANVYYHSYSAERPAALHAVVTLLDWARAAELAPLRASDYAAAADGFFSSRVIPLGQERWRVENRDGLQTVRFDRAEAREVDLARSLGVVGSVHTQGSLYVTLDPAVPAAVVALRPPGAGVDRPADGSAASLVDSRWRLRDVRRAPCLLDFATEGFGAGEFRFEGLPVRPLRITARRGATLLAELHLQPDDARGTASFTLPAVGIEPLRVSVGCEASGGPGL